MLPAIVKGHDIIRVGDRFVYRNRSTGEFTTEPAALKTPEQQIAELERQNKTLQAQLEASIQSNQMLEDCLVEMAGVVYA